MNLLLRHISVRVPWHDSGWIVYICNAGLEPDLIFEEIEVETKNIKNRNQSL